MLLNLTTWLFFRLLLLHPFYVSVCEIGYNKKNSSLEVTHRIFADDLAARFSDLYNESFSFKEPSGRIDTVLQTYLARHFSVIVNGKKAAVNYIGYETEEDAVWIYQEVENVNSLKSVRIRNTLLMDYTEEQSNIVHFKYDDEIKSYQLTVKKPECEFQDFENW